MGKQPQKEQKFAPGNVPRVASLAVPTGDPRLNSPYGTKEGPGQRVYPRQSQADMRAARENVAAKVANFGLVPPEGGGGAPLGLPDKRLFNEKVVLVRVGTRCPTCQEVRWEK